MQFLNRKRLLSYINPEGDFRFLLDNEGLGFLFRQVVSMGKGDQYSYRLLTN